MRRIPSKKTNYIRSTFSKSSIVTEAINQEISKLSLPEIHISPEEAKILQLLICLQNISSIVEIGTHAGYSTIWMAEMLKNEGKIYTIEKDPMRAKVARNHFLKYNFSNIQLFEGDALNILPSLTQFGPFDMIFIDANKSKYIDYLDWAEVNIRKNGLIVADNILLFGALYNDEDMWPSFVSKTMVSNMHLFNERITNKEKFFTVLLPTDEGLSISIKLF